MAKQKTEFSCTQCGEVFPKWMGQCPACESWNSLVEITIDTSKAKVLQSLPTAIPTPLNEVSKEENIRISTRLSELDKTLGGGLVIGSVVLLGGAPGIGKSTLILQVLASIHQEYEVLYVSGEESSAQIKNRATRLGIQSDLLLLSSDSLGHILKYAQEIKPRVLVIDSIQTIASDELASAAGSVAQVRHCAALLTSFAKQSGTILIMIGHVTKEGALAGPRVLEHMVDTVLAFEGDSAERYRIIRAVKNRFGAVNEISVFAMLEQGLKQVKNPSGIFLSTQDNTASGRVFVAVREGTRPLLVELQALVDTTSGNPKRVCVGLEQNRLVLQLAILSKHGQLPTYDKDVFLNVVGGIKIVETASDLAVIVAIFSSITEQVIDNNTIIFGEVGLTGEVRPVYGATERLNEAKKQGFTTAIIPQANTPKTAIVGMKIVAIKHIGEALKYISQR